MQVTATQSPFLTYEEAACYCRCDRTTLWRGFDLALSRRAVRARPSGSASTSWTAGWTRATGRSDVCGA